MTTVTSVNEVNIRITEENKGMARIDVKEIADLTSQLLKTPYDRIWSSYNKEVDVLYLNFKKPSNADDSELTEDDLIIRYEKGEIVGITILNAGKRHFAGRL